MRQFANLTRLFAALLFLSLLVGCGAQLAQMGNIPIVDPIDKNAVVAATEIAVIEQTGSTSITGPAIFHDGTLTGNYYRVRSWVREDGGSPDGVFQVVVTAQLRSWALLDQAHSEGEPLETRRMEREENCRKSGCRYLEVVGIMLDQAQARRYAGTGMSFRVSGQRSSLTMTIPAEYFAAILEQYLKLKAA